MLAFECRVDVVALRHPAAAGIPAVQPERHGGIGADLAFNTAASFTTNTNWQAYSGETTMTYFTQIVGIWRTYNFVSAAIGIALAHRHHPRPCRTRAETPRQLLGRHDPRHAVGAAPFCIVGALLLVSQGVVQNLGALRPRAAGRPARCDDARSRRSRRGRSASQESIKMGHQRRRLLRRQQRASLREPDAVLELHRDVLDLRRSRSA